MIAPANHVPELFTRAADLFADALDADAPSRKSLLAAAEPALRDQVEPLLALAAAAGSFLESPCWSIGEAPEEPELPPGTRIGRYTIVSLIARGGMGVVYRARQDDPARDVALKLVRPGCASPQITRRLRHEPRLLARLQHPGIAQVYEAGVHHDGAGAHPYFAMELVEGRHITVHAAGRPLESRLGLLAQVCEAVAHAHQRAVIHRDLKPANILVDASGHAKVLDFGVARLTDTDSVQSIATDAGFVGTIPYMSPEQLAADSDFDTRCDIYALGVVAFELLAGRHPYDPVPTTIPGALAAFRDRRPARPSTLNRDLRGDIELVLLRAIAADRADRYQSAADLGRDLRAILRHEPITPPHARPTLTVLRDLCRRHPAMTAGIGAAVLALSAGVISTSWQAVRATRAEHRAVRHAADLRRVARELLSANANLEVAAGTLAQRRAWIAAVVPALQTLAAQEPDDPALLLEMANAYVALARIQGSPQRPGEGDLAEAERSYRASISLLERLAETTPPDPGLRFALPRARSELAHVLIARGHPEPADRMLGLAVSELENAVMTRPVDLVLRSALADVSERRVRLAASIPDPSAARSAAQHARDFFNALPRVVNASADDMYSAGCIELCLARLDLETGRLDSALAGFVSARDVLAPLIEADPHTVAPRLTVADTWRLQAQACQAGQDTAGRVAALDRAASLYRAIHADIPERSDAIEVLVTVLAQEAILLADSPASTPDSLRPAEIAEESIALAESLLTADPSSDQARLRLVSALTASAHVLFHDSQRPGAAAGAPRLVSAPLERALGIIRDEAAIRALSTEWIAARAQLQSIRGKCEAATGRADSH